MQTDSLVIFKNQPAWVVGRDDKKVEIELVTEKKIKLPPKNLLLLHEGGFKKFDQLKSLGEGEMLEAWNLLQGENTTYAELSELIYGEYTPNTAYATWLLVQKGEHFVEDDSAIHVNDEQTVLDIIEAAKQKQQKAEALAAFIGRLKQKTYQPEDGAFIKELESFALGQVTNCRFFKLLELEETPQNAHSILLAIGFWNEFKNPYPARMGASINSLQLLLPESTEDLRMDLTHLESFAIDDEGSNDPDDAISYDKSSNKLWVHIADPARFVTPDSALDEEARARGSNLYLPEYVVPMLPHEMTEKLGLGLQETSPALSVGFSVNNGEIENIEIVLSTIKVTRLTYQEAEDKLSESPFSTFVQFSEQFSAYRQKNGAVELQFPEVRIKFENEQVEITELGVLKSRNIVRDAMLMTGVAVAKFADQNDIPLPFSTQPKHDLTVEEQCPSKLSEMFAIRRKLQKGQYKTQPDQHAGMGLPAYVQATSPLRRYLDLVVHQQLRKFLNNETLFTTDDILLRIASSESGMKTARQTENMSNNHWKCVYLMQNESWEGKAIVIEKQHNNRVMVIIPALSLVKKLMLSTAAELDETIYVKSSQVKLPTQDTYFQVIQQIEGSKKV